MDETNSQRKIRTHRMAEKVRHICEATGDTKAKTKLRQNGRERMIPNPREMSR